MTIDLSGQTVLVTGASRGIGRALARSVGAAGATVALHANRSRNAVETLAGDLGNDSFACTADLTDPHAAVTLWSEVTERARRVHAVVNNAAVAQAASPEASLDDWLDVWDRTMAVNLRAVAVICRLAAGHFAEHGGGRIVNVASRAAFRGDTPAYTAYAASKAGVVALTRSIARGHGADGVAAFVLAPGFTRTDMAQPFIETYGEDYATSDLALPRMTEPEDLAPMVTLLVSGRADHATGTTIDMNAGSYVH